MASIALICRFFLSVVEEVLVELKLHCRQSGSAGYRVLVIVLPKAF